MTSVDIRGKKIVLLLFSLYIRRLLLKNFCSSCVACQLNLSHVSWTCLSFLLSLNPKLWPIWDIGWFSHSFLPAFALQFNHASSLITWAPSPRWSSRHLGPTVLPCSLGNSSLDFKLQKAVASADCLRRSIWSYLAKIRHLLIWPSSPTSVNLSQSSSGQDIKWHVYKDIHWSTIDNYKRRKESKWPLVGGWIIYLVYLYVVEYYRAVKRDEIFITRIWSNEKSKGQKHVYNMIHFMYSYEYEVIHILYFQKEAMEK